LTLLTETYNYQWQRVMRSELSDVDFSPKIDAHTFASPKEMFDAATKKPWTAQEMGKNESEVARATGIQPPRPEYIPEGFKFDGVGIHRCDPSSTATIAALSRYTDGLNTLTIFAMKKMGAAAKGVSPTQVCDFGPGTLTMRTTSQGHLIAVSDLPSATLKKVINSTQMKLAP
jgi:negative regulator of sigma E activity